MTVLQSWLSSQDLNNSSNTVIVYYSIFRANIFFFCGMHQLGVHSAKCRHQSPEWTILSHVSCFIQGEVVGFQVLLDSLHPRGARVSWWSPPVLQSNIVIDYLRIYHV